MTATRGEETWITNAIIMTQDQNRSVVSGHLQIVDGRIAAITRTAPKKVSKKTKVVDAAGAVLIPGFVQCHIHLCQTLFRSLADELELLDWLSQRIWPMEAAHTRQSLYISALAGIHELLSSGTTCILDMGTVRHTDVIYKAAWETGIRANIGKCLMDDPQAPEGLRESTDQALKEAASLYRKWHGKGNDRIRASYAPRFALSCTSELMKGVVKLASEQNALIHTHASENSKEIQLVRDKYHCENIEYLDRIGLTDQHLVLAHGVWLSAGEKEILRKKDVHITHCPGSNLKLASGIAPIVDLRSRSINVALGADGAPSNNNLSMFQEMRLAALIHKPGAGPRALRAIEALDMATRNGALALGWFDQIGTLEVGKKADIAAINLDRPENFVLTSRRKDPEALASALVYCSHPGHVVWTMVDGHFVYRDGLVKGISASSLMQKVHKTQNQIFSACLKV